ncbi:MAG: hypothetical protein LBP37_07535 [Spirochaetaceae bacterium]|nr:hypothetical protein [Spirochaetaceae bacterium]
MYYQVDINDVVRNYELSESEGFLFCLFEAVSNALYCCANNQDIRITVRFTRNYKANDIIKDNDNFITALSVTDNGTGFIVVLLYNTKYICYDMRHGIRCGI